MNENPEKQNRSEQLRTILNNWLVYLSQIFLFALGIAAIIGISFLFTGGFSAQGYSDRLFISGIILTTIGVVVFISMAGTRKNMGLPIIAKTEEDARNIMDQTPMLLEKTEKRYDAASQVWAIGIACLFWSILLYFLLSILKF